MLTMERIQTLASRPERAGNSVLTVYLDVDQSKQSNLNRGFETQLRDMLARIRANIRSEEEVKLFETASKRIEDFVAGYDIGAHGLAAVFDAADGFFWGEELEFPLRNRIHWGRELFVQPLAAAVDEYEPVGIVLLDRANLRLFTLVLGRVEELVQERFDRRKVRHTKTVGMDHLGSASRAQRKADEQVRLNLKHVVKDMASMLEPRGIRRIILAGSPEITAELRRILPKRLAPKVIGTVDLSGTATIEEIRGVAAPVAEQFELETEEAIVDSLVTSAAKSEPVVIGLGHTLNAVNQRRVWQLVYAEEFDSTGYECTSCGALFSIDTASCSLCGASVSAVEGVVERAVDHAIRKGVAVEVIRGDEAEAKLINAGGIGALLRTRTARLSPWERSARRAG